MKYRTRESVFNFIMVAIRRVLYIIFKLDKHRKYSKFILNDNYFPVLYYNSKEKFYRFGCYCFTCPCNDNGICMSKFIQIPYEWMHEFDGDNIIKNTCG